MGKFIIQPHGRLVEMVAHEKGFFADEGLDYVLKGGNIGETGKTRGRGGKYRGDPFRRLSIL